MMPGKLPQEYLWCLSVGVAIPGGIPPEQVSAPARFAEACGARQLASPVFSGEGMV